LKVPKSQWNSFGKYNYRSTEDILDALKPLLLKYGASLIIFDTIKEVGGELFSEATVELRTKEGVVSVTASAGIDVEKKGMDKAQCYGSSSSYSRKYALGGLFLIDDTKDSDATNTHGKGGEFESRGENKIAVKPRITDDILQVAINSINNGEQNVIERVSANFLITEGQRNLLLKTINTR